MTKLKFATVCSSNMNRSMEAHYQLQNLGYHVRSYGTGTQVRLPGPSQDKPNIYEFGTTTYKDILADLTRKDEALYTHNGPHTRSQKLVVLQDYKYQISGTEALQISGLLHMLNRNVKVKDAPERWQDHDRSQALDVVLTYEERVWDAVLQDVQSQDGDEFRPLHIINLDTTDNHKEAVAAALVTCELCKMLGELSDLESSVVKTISDFETRTKRPTLYSLVYV